MTAPTTSYHLRPEQGWLNDPNGMTCIDGVWHVFFQHNPAAPVHGQIAWGHATSTDLAMWRLRPVAFSPTPGGPDAFGCWSGVFVPGHDRPAVAYSGIADDSGQSTICLRWGSPDLIDWEAPIVVGRTPDADGIGIMRDPFVFEYEGRQLAVLGAGMRDGSPAVILYDRSDELAWRYLGVLVADDPVLRGAGAADIWECPQLFPVEDRWVLVVSLHDRGELGQVVAAVGDLEPDGEGLRFVAESVNVLDDGTDFYAPQVSLADGEPLLMGWVRQDGQDPAVRDHAGCLTLPRRLALADGVVVSRMDRGVAAALVGAVEPLAAGETVLANRRWRVMVMGAGARMTHPSLGEVELAPGSRLWVDGAVVELYRPSGIAATWRHDEPWTLTLEEAGAVEVRRVVPRVP
ncbi:MAG: glycoside hydrolase family 32 protein [Propionibacteriaceae bacterium]|nr:glycoside hydrolase family 32 protein [Propionibacteriaceae bacterium]